MDSFKKKKYIYEPDPAKVKHEFYPIFYINFL